MKYKFKKFLNIEIVAKTDKEIKKITEALEFIKIEDEKSFSILRNLKAILVLPKKRYDNTLFVKESVYICQAGTILRSSVFYLASLFVHEVRHLWQYRKGKHYYGNKAEQDAYKFQRKFLKKFGEKSKKEIKWLDKLFKEKWWIYTNKKGKKTLISPNDKLFINFLNKYLENKL